MPEITEEDVRQAETEAHEAQRRFLDLQHAALNGEPGNRPSAVDVVAAQTEAQHAEMRIEVTRRRYAEAREAERRRQLAGLGGRVETFYAETAASRTIPVLASNVAEAVAAFHAGIAAHNERVAGYHREAEDLGTQPGPHGPRAQDSHVGRTNGIRYRHMEVLPVSGNAEAYALHHLVSGDVDKAMAELVVTHDHTPQPPREVWRDSYGQFPPMPVYATRDKPLSMMIADGRAVRMTDTEAAEWWSRQPK